MNARAAIFLINTFQHVSLHTRVFRHAFFAMQSFVKALDEGIHHSVTSSRCKCFIKIKDIYLCIVKMLLLLFFMPPPFEEWWRGIKCFMYPCPSVIKIWFLSITFERLHWFNSNLVCWYIVSKHRSSSIWVTI